MSERLSTKHKLVYVYRSADRPGGYENPDGKITFEPEGLTAYFCSLSIDAIEGFIRDPFVGPFDRSRGEWKTDAYNPGRDIFGTVLKLGFSPELRHSMQIIYFWGPFYLTSSRYSPYQLCANWRSHRESYVQCARIRRNDKRAPQSRRCYAGRTVNWFVNWVEACGGTYETEFDRQLGRLAKSLT